MFFDLQDVDVVVQFPADAAESTVLYYRSRLERLPGLIVRVCSMAADKKIKIKLKPDGGDSSNREQQEQQDPNSYAFHLSATYQG